MEQKNIILLSVFVLVAALLVACTQVAETPTIKTPVTTPVTTGETGSETTDGLKKFETKADLLSYLKEAGTSSSLSGSSMRSGGIVAEMVAMDGMAKVSAAPTAGGSDSGTATTYSQTNVQVKGVDEADIVKNDGNYIYTITGDILVIVDAFPAKDAEIVSETPIKGSPQNIFVNGDRLVVFATDSDEFPIIAEYDFAPRPQWSQVTHAYLYDIADRTDPELVQDYTIRGNFFQARMIGDYVYFVVNEGVNYYYHDIDLPFIKGTGDIMVRPEVYYFDNPEDNYQFNTVASFNIKEDDDINAKTFMLGYSNTLYVSTDNIYIAYQKNLPWRYYDGHQKERFFEVVIPLLPPETQSKINAVKAGSSEDYEQWDEIATILEEMYNGMDEREKISLIEDIEEAVDEYEAKIEAERRKTIIHKIGIDEGKIDYVARGEVKGYLLNQFSMDEHSGNLRVATTTEIWSGKSEMYNNVFVLDASMKQVGSLEDIAPDERIYSTRFIGDRLYMVTFKRIDPLFVIDLSDATKPKILGELKIPGYSDYLHPYDEDHIIGIGKETEANEWGGVSTAGVKLALFDVSDVTSPKLLDKYEIGESGTDSEALYDHKAFLFDKEKDLLVIPVREVKGERYYSDRYGYYQQKIWQGAYVFSLTPEDGFSVKGKVTHQDGNERSDYWYYTSPSAVRRALFMDDVLYTVSSKTILMNDLDDLSVEVGEVELPFKDDEWYPRYWY